MNKIIKNMYKDNPFYIYRMSTTKTQSILSLYKSRITLLEQLDQQNYDTSEYETFSVNEIDAMLANTQLDMLVSNPTDGRKAYIKYYLSAKQIRPANLDEIIEDLYVIDNVLTKKDTLIIVIEDEPNDTIITKIKYLFDHDGIFVIIHNIHRLQYNILFHKLVPECNILSETDLAELKQKININTTKQLPEISRFDPQALAIGLRPGQVVKFNRHSPTAIFETYYRVCV
jgi:DNA-directed RNA polymerase subunit H (RpoH/RPB5)